MIGIIDYGLGNLASVAGAVNRLGFESEISNDAKILQQCHKLILPGVGAFGDAMANLRQKDLIGVLNDLVRRRGTPILGICLGAQLFTKGSEEFGWTDGLGWVDADVRSLRCVGPNLPIPHVGWNDIQHIGDSTLFQNVPLDALFYFVHSFCILVNNQKVVNATCDYNRVFSAAFQQENIYAVQFHPEKSQLYGLKVLNNFLEIE